MVNVIKRVYIAGRLSPTGANSVHPAIDYLINVREMTRWGVKTLLAGFDPFVPSLDGQFWGQLRQGEFITEPMIKRFSKSWLEVCDAVLLTPGWQESKGTLAEIKLANELNIPVFKSLEDLIEVSREQKED